MGRRKSDSLIDDLYDGFLRVPWWVGPLIAGAVFLLAKFIGMQGSRDDVAGIAMPNLISLAAPWMAGFVLMIWGFAELRKFFNRALLDRQDGIESIRELSWQDFEVLLTEAFRRDG